MSGYKEVKFWFVLRVTGGSCRVFCMILRAAAWSLMAFVDWIRELKKIMIPALVQGKHVSEVGCEFLDYEGYFTSRSCNEIPALPLPFLIIHSILPLSLLSLSTLGGHSSMPCSAPSAKFATLDLGLESEDLGCFGFVSIVRIALLHRVLI